MFTRLRRLFQRERVDVTERRERRKEAVLPRENNEGRRRWSWRMWQVRRQTSSPAHDLIKKVVMEVEERLTEELQLITQNTNQARDRLIFLTDGSINKRPFRRLDPQYELLKYKEKKVMSFLHSLEIDTINSRKHLEELKKETNFYSNFHNRIVTEKNLVKKDLDTLNQEIMTVQVDWNSIQKYLLEFILNDKDEQKETSKLQTQHHQVSETARGLRLATTQKQHPLQNELPAQEPPAELHPQQPENSLDQSSST
ncbi:disks large homolog 5-like [Grammomys surdaster]|uniref:disks large homolog 5-like n=1 Tax=Grammomys surdaster TaxID=491861 RepID=UPI00109FD976|nr:disks large homolog 5-like [Grammomys surdaster]